MKMSALCTQLFAMSVLYSCCRALVLSPIYVGKSPQFYTRNPHWAGRCRSSPGKTLRYASFPCLLRMAHKDLPKKFNEWLIENSVLNQDSGVRVRNCKMFGMGLVAQRTIEYQEVVLEVPAALHLSEDSAVDCMGELGMFLKSILQDWRMWNAGGDMVIDLGDSLIALRILHEISQGDKSRLAVHRKPYIDILPRSLDSPLFWPPEERKRLLAGCQIDLDTQRLSDLIEQEFGMLEDFVFQMYPEIFDPQVFTLSMYKWAISMSISRAYSGSSIKGMSPGLILFPGLDMANHDDSVKFAVLPGDGVFSELGSVTIVVDKQYAKDEQVFTTYGCKSNAQLLYAFGFTRNDPYHPYNSADIALELPIDVPYRDRRMEVLSVAGMYPRMRFQVPVCETFLQAGLSQRSPSRSRKDIDNELTVGLIKSWSQVLPFCRLACMGGPEADNMFSTEDRDPDEIWAAMWEPLSQTSERAAVDWLLQHMDSKINVLITPINSDVGENEGARTRHDMAAVVRKSESAALEAGKRAVLALESLA